MKPDRAHRLLNTILLVMVLGAVTFSQPSLVEPTTTDYLIQAAYWLAVLALVILMIRAGVNHTEEIARYLGLQSGET